MFLEALLPYMLTVVVAAIIVPSYDALQKGIAALKKLPAPATQIIIGAGAFLLNYAAQVKFADLSCAPTCSPDTLSQGDTSLLLTSLLTYGLTVLFKLGKQAKAAR